MIELINVEKKYPTAHGDLHALKNINLKIKAGEIFGIIGKSGAGKSTLIRCINLLERPSAGEIYVDGQNLITLAETQLRLARHHIGMIFQHFNLLTSRTVFANIALPLEFMGYSKKKIQQTVMPLLELTGLLEKKSAYPAQLSGGQKQRVAIARALASQPKILLCDEATSALDWHTTLAILELLKDINAKLNVTIFLITHEMEVIKNICDRVALLDQGEIIEQAELFEFFTQPKTALAKELIKSCLKQELPAALQDTLSPQHTPTSHPVLRIIFFGKAANQPLIANMMQNFKIGLNIWQANMELLKTAALGTMIVEVMSHDNNLTEGLHYLQQQGVFVETIGYV
ncbi:methionine ABC transporter ATP-binding protein [soil metagenome]